MKEKIKNLFQNRIFLIAILIILLIATGALIYISGNTQNNKNKEETKEEVKEKSLNETDTFPIPIVLKENVVIELNRDISKITYKELIENYSEFKEKEFEVLSGLDLENVDTSKEGEYTYTLNYNQETLTGKITVKKLEEQNKENKKEEEKKNNNSNTSKSNNNSTNSNTNSNNTDNKLQNNTNSNTPTPAPTSTPAPVASVPQGTWSSNGWTVVSNGDGTGTASVRGITRNIKIEKDMNCDTCYLVINTSTSRGNLLAIGNPKGYTWRSDKDIGMINTANNTLNNVPELRDLSEIERDYRVTINGISIPNRQINNESDDTLVEYYHLGNDITYKYWDIIDNNFNYAGMIVLKGTPNTDIITDAARDHNWEQIYIN